MIAVVAARLCFGVLQSFKDTAECLFFINQLRILFVVFPSRADATCISLSLIKAAACFAMWSFLLHSNATPHVLQSVFVYAFTMSLIIILLVAYFNIPDSSLKLKKLMKDTDKLVTLDGQVHNGMTENVEYKGENEKLLSH